MLFLGHFHPLLVHLPIGALILLGFLEVLAGLSRWKRAAENSVFIIGFAAVSACLSSALGWMLAQSGDYEANLLNPHRLLGIAVSTTSVATLLLRHCEWLRAYRAGLAVTLILLAIASHLGGSITHGRDFLTGFSRNGLRIKVDAPAKEPTPSTGQTSGVQHSVFTAVIQPILLERCSACHGPQKHRGNLRLDSFEALQRGGRNGVVVKLGQAKESSLVKRILVPLNEEGHMPPDTSPQATPQEIAILSWWVDAGMPIDRTLDDLKPAPEIRRSLEIVSRKPEPRP